MEPQWRRFEFKREKFIELLLYFSQRGLTERLVIGSTRLNKLLFFTDMRTYAELGQPITGARYQRLEFGPAARAMLPVREELVRDGEAEFEDRGQDDWSNVIVPLRAPNLGLFTEDELRIANEVFEELRPFNAVEVSDYAHLKSAGWNVMEDHEDIPYEFAFVSTEPAQPEAIERGRELAALHGW
jgi:hypothetical protein